MRPNQQRHSTEGHVSHEQVLSPSSNNTKQDIHQSKDVYLVNTVNKNYNKSDTIATDSHQTSFARRQIMVIGVHQQLWNNATYFLHTDIFQATFIMCR